MKTLYSAFALVVASATCISGCNSPQFSSKKDFQKTIPINSQVNVNVQTFNGSITITPSDQSEIDLIAHIKTSGYSQEEADAATELLVPEIDTTTSTITITCKKRNQLLNWSDSVNLELKVPASWPLNLSTSNGSVSTTQSRGPVVIETSNGKIEVKEAAGSLKLSTSNGKIVVENSAGNIDADTSNGSIQVSNCAFEGKCKLESSNGAISVGFSDRTPIELDAITSNGSIKFNEADLKVKKKSKRQITGTLFAKAGDSTPSASLQIETSNGFITISTAAQPSSAPKTSLETSAN